MVRVALRRHYRLIKRGARGQRVKACRRPLRHNPNTDVVIGPCDRNLLPLPSVITKHGGITTGPKGCSGKP